MDSYALFFMGLIVAASFAVALLAYGLPGATERQPGGILYPAPGGDARRHGPLRQHPLTSFFLGLEILSVALYALIAYLHERPRPVEAGIKYLVLAAASAAFLLFGIALIYADLGTMDFASIAQLLATKADLNPTLLLPGVALIVTGIGFKLALVPFHMWTPDVYRGGARAGDSLRCHGFKRRHVRAAASLLQSVGFQSWPIRARGSRVLDHRHRFHVYR